MTTSSNHKTPEPPTPVGGDHWQELTATLSVEMTEEFGLWLSEELESLEADKAEYVTRNSVKRSLRR